MIGRTETRRSKVSLPGDALASAISSATVVAFTPGFTASTIGTDAIRAIAYPVRD